MLVNWDAHSWQILNCRIWPRCLSKVPYAKCQDHIKGFIFLKFIFFLNKDVGDWTRDLSHARQALHRWALEVLFFEEELNCLILFCKNINSVFTLVPSKMSLCGSLLNDHDSSLDTSHPSDWTTVSPDQHLYISCLSPVWRFFSHGLFREVQHWVWGGGLSAACNCQVTPITQTMEISCNLGVVLPALLQ